MTDQSLANLMRLMTEHADLSGENATLRAHVAELEDWRRVGRDAADKLSAEFNRVRELEAENATLRARVAELTARKVAVVGACLCGITHLEIDSIDCGMTLTCPTCSQPIIFDVQSPKQRKQVYARVVQLESGYDELRTVCNRQQTKLRTAEAELAATTRELERWRHGEPVEGDFVCPDTLRVVEMEAEVRQLQDTIEYSSKAYLAEHEHWGECKWLLQVADMSAQRATSEARERRTAEVLDDLIGVAEAAMREANNDGAEYDIDAELRDARAALASPTAALPPE